MVAQNVFFGIMALVMIFAALKVVSTKNVVHAALWLVVVLGGVAGQFLLLGAEFIGITPNTSDKIAIVLAVPITGQVPEVVAKLFSTFSISFLEISFDLNCDQYLLQSVHAPTL